MQSRTLFAILAILGFCTASHGALTGSEIIKGIQDLAQKSQELQAPAMNINPLDGALIAIGQGSLAKVIAGLADVVTTGSGIITKFQGTGSIKDTKEADNVADSFKAFAQLHQQLLNILIGKAGLFTTLPLVGGPMTTVLRQVEAVVDSLSYGLVDVLEETAAEKVKSQAKSLDETLRRTIAAYDYSSQAVTRKLLRERAVTVAASA